MRTNKKWLAAALLLAVTTATVSAQTVADFNVELTNDGEGVRIKGYTGKVMAVKIPAEIEGMPVKEIGYGAFSGQKITSVTFPAGLVKIGGRAFNKCSGLTSVVIPDSVTVIGNGAFAGCYYFDDWTEKKVGLTSVTLPKNLTTFEEGGDDTGVFEGCRLLTSVKFTGTALTEIPGGMFVGTAITTLVIPEGVTKLGERAFGTSLTSITLPSTLIEIGRRAFFATQLKTIVIPDSVTTIGNMAFHGCTELTSVTLGAGIKSIGEYAFRECESLTTFAIPDSVEKVIIHRQSRWL
jgi:hypothetical protein